MKRTYISFESFLRILECADCVEGESSAVTSGSDDVSFGPPYRVIGMHASSCENVVAAPLFTCPCLHIKAECLVLELGHYQM